MPDTRLVPMARAQRERLDRIIRSLEDYGGLLGNTNAQTVQEIRAAWDAAPADATEAAILGTMLPNYTENDRAFVTPIVLNVLRALGMPNA